MWKVCVKEPYLNVEKIFPTQQKDVGTVISVWKKELWYMNETLLDEAKLNMVGYHLQQTENRMEWEYEL
ncbi:MAG: hypothetical protein NC293_00515 [Roseburia sp.]|nr:hypothetical protein [Roseburia sp.]